FVGLFFHQLATKREECLYVIPSVSEGSVWAGGALNEQNGAAHPHRFLAHARDDTRTLTSECSQSALAGISSLTAPLRSLSIAARLFPPARSTIRRDSRIVPMPMVMACVAGVRFTARVSALSATTRVRDVNGVPGSLKAMCPLPPRPRKVRPSPPAAAMARS